MLEFWPLEMLGMSFLGTLTSRLIVICQLSHDVTSQHLHTWQKLNKSDHSHFCIESRPSCWFLPSLLASVHETQSYLDAFNASARRWRAFMKAAGDGRVPSEYARATLAVIWTEGERPGRKTPALPMRKVCQSGD